jgi:DNA replication and repair protein RecF
VFTLDPTYLQTARDYRSALKQKNALLREARRTGRPPDATLLAIWNDKLVEAGAQVVLRRTDFLRQFAPVFREVHQGITAAAKGRAEFRYRGCVGTEAVSDGLSGIEAALHTKVAAAAAQEATRGFCTVGPHRDDWELRVGEEPLRSFGSQGQIRSAALAMRIGQMVLAKSLTGACPLFLLDDVSSELDPHRNAHLMSLLLDLEAQVLITTTHRSNLLLETGSYRSWHVIEGTVSLD